MLEVAGEVGGLLHRGGIETQPSEDREPRNDRPGADRRDLPRPRFRLVVERGERCLEPAQVAVADLGGKVRREGIAAVDFPGLVFVVAAVEAAPAAAEVLGFGLAGARADVELRRRRQCNQRCAQAESNYPCFVHPDLLVIATTRPSRGAQPLVNPSGGTLGNARYFRLVDATTTCRPLSLLLHDSVPEDADALHLELDEVAG